jgi:hypothetical protein
MTSSKTMTNELNLHSGFEWRFRQRLNSAFVKFDSSSHPCLNILRRRIAGCGVCELNSLDTLYITVISTARMIMNHFNHWLARHLTAYKILVYVTSISCTLLFISPFSNVDNKNAGGLMNRKLDDTQRI